MKGALILLALTYVWAVPIQDEGAVQEFVNGNRIFSAAVYKEIIKNTGGNLVVSPLSAETILALTYEGTRGATAAELITGLSLPSTTEKIETAFQGFLPRLRNVNDRLSVTVANKIFVENGFLLNDNFKSVAANVYGSGAENIEFRNSVDAAAEINNWVEDQTNHKIKNIAGPDSFDDTTRIVLVNALYLKGEWEIPFWEAFTKKEEFFTSPDVSVKVDTMHQEFAYPYYENKDLDATYLELPLAGGEVSLVIVLPNQIDGLAKLEENIAQVLAPQPLVRKQIAVSLPKFKIESQIEFIPILYNLGIHSLFEPFLADFSGMASDSEGMAVTDVLQKAFIEVNENGIEAAAATAIAVATDEVPVAATFKADHPFLYYIQDNGAILFSGRYISPEAEQ